MEKNKISGKGGKNDTPEQKTNGSAVAQTNATPKAELRDNSPAVQPEVTAEPVKELSVDDKIRKIELLSEAIEKRTLLKTHLARVEALKFGEFEEKDSLTINTSTGGAYVIKSTSLIKEIAQLTKARIEEQIIIVEGQINF